MTERQKHLIRSYARTDNVYEAAAAAFYTTKHIRQTLLALLETDAGLAVYQEEKRRLDMPNAKPTVPALPPIDATAEAEVFKSHLTDYLLSLIDGRVPNSTDYVSVAQRTRAAELLAKVQRLFAEPPPAAEDAPVIVDLPK